MHIYTCLFTRESSFSLETQKERDRRKERKKKESEIEYRSTTAANFSTLKPSHNKQSIISMSEYLMGLPKSSITFTIAQGRGFKKRSKIPSTCYSFEIFSNFSPFQLLHLNFLHAPWPPSLQTADRGSGEQQVNTDVVFQCLYTSLLSVLCGWYLNHPLCSGGIRIPRTIAKTRRWETLFVWDICACHQHFCDFNNAFAFWTGIYSPYERFNRCMGWYENRVLLIARNCWVGENFEWENWLYCSAQPDAVWRENVCVREHYVCYFPSLDFSCC